MHSTDIGKSRCWKSSPFFALIRTYHVSRRHFPFSHPIDDIHLIEYCRRTTLFINSIVECTRQSKTSPRPFLHRMAFLPFARKNLCHNGARQRKATAFANFASKKSVTNGCKNGRNLGLLQLRPPLFSRLPELGCAGKRYFATIVFRVRVYPSLKNYAK